MSNDEITYEQVLEYCKKRNYALIDREFLHIMIGDKPMELWGLPIETAQRVIEIYKYKGIVPTTDYDEGFKDGMEYTKIIYEKVMNELIQNIMR